MYQEKTLGLKTPQKIIRKSSWKSVALPAEHGAWGFLLEPILLGLLAVPSWAGWWLGIATVGAFLLHQPLKMAIKDRLRGKHYDRTALAERFAFGFGAVALLGFSLALINTSGNFLIPIMIGVPFALLQLFYAANNRGREALPEIAGAIALGTAAPAIALAGGWTLEQALPLLIIPVLRSAPAILYVRARLRLLRGEAADSRQALAAHAAAVGIALVTWMAGWLPVTIIMVMVILMARSVWGLNSKTPIVAKVVGFQEIGFGLLTVILAALGYGLVK